MTNAESFFAQSYAEARAKFIAAAEAAGADLHTRRHPLLGHDGEELAMDVARIGPADAERVLIVTSACHGVEGFCGSGVQGALLADDSFLAEARGSGVALLFIHALNPYGFSWWRRTTQENVDLNRNWHDFSRELPHNAAYAEIAHAVLPATWPPGDAAETQLRDFAARHGAKALQAAITAGQYEFPEGLFFGGHNPTWSRQTLDRVLQEQLGHCRRLSWIDVHTGLGPGGHAELIYAGRDDAAAVARARAWWGPGVTSIYDGSSSSALLSGLMWSVAYTAAPQAEYTGIAFEVGTVPVDDVISALREDQWYENHPEAGAAARAAARRRMRDSFYTDTPAWKAQVLEQAGRVARQAVAGLR